VVESPGQFEMLKAADPVYKLVAGDGCGGRGSTEVGNAADRGSDISSGRETFDDPED